MKKSSCDHEKHFTASVWILTSSNPKKILLVHHKKLRKWVQPGGHINSDENPLQTAIREVNEETGLDIRFLSDTTLIIDADSTLLRTPDFLVEQVIPEYKDQPQHYHLDLQYVIKIEEKTLVFDPRESNSIGWFTHKEATSLPLHKNTFIILNKLFNKSY